MARKKSTNHYVDNKKLYTEMLHYINELREAKENGIEPTDKNYPRISNYIGECITLIAERFATKPNFSRYSYKDEMIEDGIEKCIMYIHNFNPDKYNNPLAYFTQIIFHAFLQRINKEEKEQYIRYKYSTYQNVSHGLADTQDDSSYYNSNLLQLDDEKILKLTKKFEPKALEKQKKKAKEKGVELFIKDDDNDTDTSSDTTDA